MGSHFTELVSSQISEDQWVARNYDNGDGNDEKGKDDYRMEGGKGWKKTCYFNWLYKHHVIWNQSGWLRNN